jgi:hypothetical protein
MMWTDIYYGDKREPRQFDNARKVSAYPTLEYGESVLYLNGVTITQGEKGKLVIELGEGVFIESQELRKLVVNCRADKAFNK